LSGRLTVALLIALLAAAGDSPQVRADVVLQTASLRLEIGADGTLVSLTDTPGGVEYLSRPGKDSPAEAENLLRQARIEAR
jgi:hypothetical protein